jgi:hypothetical protein
MGRQAMIKAYELIERYGPEISRRFLRRFREEHPLPEAIPEAQVHAKEVPEPAPARSIPEVLPERQGKDLAIADDPFD